jgi:hypothetical protein
VRSIGVDGRACGRRAAIAVPGGVPDDVANEEALPEASRPGRRQARDHNDARRSWEPRHGALWVLFLLWLCVLVRPKHELTWVALARSIGLSEARGEMLLLTVSPGETKQ